MSSHQPNNLPGRGRGFRAQTRGRSHNHQNRGRGYSRGRRDSYPAIQDGQLHGSTSHQSPACLPRNPLSESIGSQAGSSNSYHLNTNPSSSNPNHPSVQIPTFTNPLAASINSAIQNVLPNCSPAQLPQNHSTGGFNPMFPCNSNSQNHRGTHFQSQGTLPTPNYFCSPGMSPRNMLGGPTPAFAGQQYQPTNLSQPMYMPNPYNPPAYNMQMMSNTTYSNGYSPMGHMNYAPSQTPIYPQTMYPVAQTIPPMNQSGWQPQWTSMQQTIPRVTAEGYTISNTAIDEFGSQSEHLNKKSKHNGRGHHSERHRCEPCHQDFPSFPALVMHRNGHQKCSEPGCKYEGNAKSVEIHEEDRHLRFKPGKEPHAQSKRPDGPAGATIQGLGYALQTEEQIAKWIEERRKRWPTSKVIAEKASKAPKGSSQVPLPSRGDHAIGRGLAKFTRGKARAGPSSSKKAPDPMPILSQEVSASTLSQKRQRHDEDEESDDNEEDEEAVLRDRYLKSRSTNGIGDNVGTTALHCDIPNDKEDPARDEVSDDDNEDMDPIRDAVSSKIVIEGPKINFTQKTDTSTKNNPNAGQTEQVPRNVNEKSIKVCKWWKMKRCKRGDSCLFAHPPRDQVTKKQKSSKNRPTSNTTTQSASGSSLLSKLLEKDIKQDVADLASVISFLVDNDFLANTELQIGEERLIEPILPDPSSTLPLHSTLIQPDLLSSGSEDFDTEDDSVEDSDSEIEDVEESDVKVEDGSLTPDSTVLDETPVNKLVNHTDVIHCIPEAH
ncbi:hypothetical protein DFH28DRAFT_1031736 [Melampsora americana]|nr:hypothetical protein DFH28DRAFT_1031736 [Melampsora americana]